MESFGAVGVENYSRSRVLVGCAAAGGADEKGTLAIVDLATGSLVSKVHQTVIRHSSC